MYFDVDQLIKTFWSANFKNIPQWSIAEYEKNIQNELLKDTHHWVLTEVIVGPSCYCVQLHQVLKITYLMLHPFLQEKT